LILSWERSVRREWRKKMTTLVGSADVLPPAVEEQAGAPASERPQLLSLVIPVKDEQLAIRPFLDRAQLCLRTALGALPKGSDYEIIFVDDGSTDATLAAILAARAIDSRIKSVVFSRNFGKEAAIAAGLRYASGDAVVPIDVDLQDPPEVIVDLVRKWREGAKVVMAVRSDRNSDGAVKRMTASLFYRIYNRMADRAIPEQVGDFRLLDRQVVDALKELPERTRFTKGLFSWVGFETAHVGYVRAKRAHGTTKWTYWRLWNLALDGITASTTVPLRIWTYCGFLMGVAAFLYASFIVVHTVVFGRDMPGYASLMTAVLLIGGLNLIALGILGEYIGRISSEVKGRPLYVLKRSIGFNCDDESGARVRHS
jgi:glycosyltransferase involved in cell wall biosynthesis